jgi:hypothetical protein
MPYLGEIFSTMAMLSDPKYAVEVFQKYFGRKTCIQVYTS